MFKILFLAKKIKRKQEKDMEKTTITPGMRMVQLLQLVNSHLDI